MAFTPPPEVPQRGARATFSGAVDAFLKWMAALPAQLDAFLARLETIAAGGAYSLHYTFRTSASLGGASSAVAVFDVANQINTNVLYLDKASFGTNVISLLQEWDNSTSGVRGVIRIQKVSDPTKQLAFAVNGPIVDNTGYVAFPGVVTSGFGSVNPFTVGDSVMVFFQPNGDKGDTGNADKKVQTAPAPVGGVVTADYRNGNCLVWSPTAGSTVTLNITNWPSSGTLGEFWIIGTNLGAATVNLGGAINWLRPDGTYANNASINTNHGATLRSAGEDNVLLWGRSGGYTNGKVAR